MTIIQRMFIVVLLLRDASDNAAKSASLSVAKPPLKLILVLNRAQYNASGTEKWRTHAITRKWSPLPLLSCDATTSHDSGD